MGKPSFFTTTLFDPRQQDFFPTNCTPVLISQTSRSVENERSINLDLGFFFSFSFKWQFVPQRHICGPGPPS
uniref:Uncharacterized protein n=1 Tax=Anguilla anguilla TaxID=7936 RepID=A0A0E9X5V1_ANGAN